MRDSRDRLPAAPLRTGSLFGIVVIGVLVVALFRLQVIKYEEYDRFSRNNYVVEASLRAPRGNIVDRNHKIIAGSRQSLSISVVPRSIMRKRGELQILAKVLAIERESVLEKLQPVSRSYRPAVILRDVDFVALSRIEELSAALPDVMVVSEPVRCYPQGDHFAHLVGYVGEVTQADIAANPATRAPGDFVGKAGIEKEYDQYLCGKDGTRYVKFSPGGGLSPVDLEDQPIEPARAGDTIVLHADDRLQRIAQEALGRNKGCIIVLELATGGVLAMASSPTYDPEALSTGISARDWKDIVESQGRPMINRAVQSTYPPGSTFKIVTAAVALEEGVITSQTRFRPCHGSYRFGNRDFKCWRGQGHGSTNLLQAMEVSCDVYFYQVGERLSLDRFSSLAGGWRLSQPVGIDLPGDTRGLIPDQAYYDRTYGAGRWTRGVMLNLAIGQGEILVSPMELLCFVCALARGGDYFEPRCVEGIETQGGFKPVQRGSIHLNLSKPTLDVVRQSMLGVVEGQSGTGRGAAIPGVRVAGKTGTAQNPHGDDHAWFVCFAPYENPEICLCVLFENSGHGGEVAVPAAKRLLEAYFGIEDPGKVACSR